MIEAAEKLIESTEAQVSDLFRRAYDFLVAGGCSPDVKTIYVSFTLGSAMVAAAYPKHETVEIALALPDDAESPLLNDASHLTWPTLPVSVVIARDSIYEDIEALLSEALMRIGNGTQNVRRPSEFFEARKRERQKRSAIP